MKKKICTCFFILHAYVLFTNTVLWADVPAPPVNQTLGVDDGIFNDLTEADCRLCHENPDQFPVDDETVPNRHHLLVDTVISDPSDAPFGIPGELYKCFSCHEIDTNPGHVDFIVERDCLVCHIQSPDGLTVHHQTDLALGTLPQGPDCQACHGSLVDNIEDGHYIPTYDPSPPTPKRSGGSGLPLNSEGNGSGACNYCHSTGTGDPFMPGIDSETNVSVYGNQDTHHNTGFGSDSTKCGWCHDFSMPFEAQIRICENCHGPVTLHSIQADSNNDGIILNELPGYGHIGGDCNGCHDFSSASSAPGAGPVVPYLSALSASVMTAGSDSTITLTGAAFTNVSEGVDFIANVILTDKYGGTIELIPDTIDEGTMTVTVPGTLAPGIYSVNTVKRDKFSNPMSISVKPEVIIHDSICDRKKGVITVIGSGFSEKPEGTDAYIDITVDGVPVSIISWTDTEIRASVSSCSKKSSITVNALYGSETYNTTNGAGKPDKPCKGKKC
jgi:hypothetical protein